MPAFRFTDLNVVMEAVEDWCDRTGDASPYLLEMVGWKCGFKGYWQIKIIGDGMRIEGEETNDDLRLALMAASVQAARKLREAA